MVLQWISWVWIPVTKHPKGLVGLVLCWFEAISGRLLQSGMFGAQMTCCPEHCARDLDSFTGILVLLGDFGKVAFPCSALVSPGRQTTYCFNSTSAGG